MTHRQRNWAPEGGDRPHHDSKVWRLGKRLAVALYDITSDFPDHERFGLIAQIRRAGVSVPSNIAEGQARDSDRELLRFLYLARSSLEEIDTQMEIADELGYLDDTESDHVQRVFGDLSRALGGFIRKVKTDISD